MALTSPTPRGLRRALAVGCLTLSIVLVAASGVLAVPVVRFPTDGTAVERADLRILGGITEKVEIVKLKVNGKLFLPFVGPNHVFEQPVRLAPGLNTIEVGDKTIRVHLVTPEQPRPAGFSTKFVHPPLADGCDGCHLKDRPGHFAEKVAIRKLCAGCHDDPAKGKGGVPPASVHSPIADDSDCLSCHDPHVGDTRQMLVKPLPGLCADCHGSVTEGRSRVHEPAASGDCAACHTPHASAAKGLLRAEPGALCLECHDDPSAGQAAAHEGMAEGCTACHAPHASSHPALLSTDQVALCGQCHDSPPSGKGVTVHSPIADDRECTACHLPHGSALAKLLRAKVPALCLDCHEDQAAPGKTGGSIHPPVADGDCMGCHSPHFGPSALLKGKAPDLCWECHDAFAKTEKGSLHSPVADGDCSACHLPHASEKPRLLRAQGSALCLDCHDAFTKPEKGSLHDPVASGDCSECHRPHSAPAPKLLAKAGAELCYSCHDRFQGAVRHDPVADDDCGGCHRPHDAPAPKLLSARGMELCLQCHDDPTAVAGGKAEASIHGPIRDDRECTPCHSPHAGGKALLRAAVPGMCYDCHEDVTKRGGKAAATVHSPVADGACFDCHLPHASSSPALAGRDPRGALCLDCHENPAAGKGGKAFSVQHAPVQEDCRKCHLAHASNAKAMLLTAGEGLCQTCHSKHEHPLSAASALQGGMAKVPAGFPLDSAKNMRCGGCHLAHGSDFPQLWTTEKAAFCGKCHAIF